MCNSERQALVDWLVSILDKYEEHMSQRTLFFSVAILNKFRSISSGPEAYCIAGLNLRLLGATCLHIASKCEDVTYIGIRDLAEQAYQGDELRDHHEILELEEQVLNVLNFDVYIPTVIDFVNIYLECVPGLCEDGPLSSFAVTNSKSILIHYNYSKKMLKRSTIINIIFDLQRFAAEMTLYDCAFMNFPTSHVAAAVIVYALTCAARVVVHSLPPGTWL